MIKGLIHLVCTVFQEEETTSLFVFVPSCVFTGLNLQGGNSQNVQDHTGLT